MSQKHREPTKVGKRERPMFPPLTPKQHATVTIPKIVRKMKRDLIASGQIMDPANRPKKFRFNWTYGEIRGAVLADDTSTARSLIKKNLGLSKKRLPTGVEITRIINMDCYQGMAQTLENLNDSTGQTQISPNLGEGCGDNLGSDGGQTG